MHENAEGPHALFMTWLACNNLLAAKEWLHRFGLVDNISCVFCRQTDSMEHLFFNSQPMRQTWGKALKWLSVKHQHGRWKNKLNWMITHSRGKGWKATLLKCAFAETIYEAWKFRSEICFRKHTYSLLVDLIIIYSVVYRIWMRPQLMKHICKLMVP